MAYETSYENGHMPFHPDLLRGKWSQSSDYVYACLGLAFKLDIFTASWWFFYDMGISAIVPNVLYMALFLVPVMVIQSFMGQFSSSGFISAFRLSPFFKGIGYVSLALNTAMLLYYNIFASVPLIFLLNSFNPILPWSCEASDSWSKNLNESERLNICNITAKESLEQFNDSSSIDYKNYHIPSVLYFRQHFENINFYSYGIDEYAISWTLLVATILLWSIIAYIFYCFSETPKFGKMLRYMILATLSLLAVCFLRFMFLPGASNGITEYIKPSVYDLYYGIFTIPIYSLQAFGGGWGSIIALSSFNNFKTDIMRYSWIICLGQMFIFIIFGLVSYMLQHHFKHLTEQSSFAFVEDNWILYISSASAIANLEWANMWSIIYYTMLVLATIIVMVTQIFAILKSLFDEFQLLRAHKRTTTFAFIGAVAVFSFYFCSNHGILYFTTLSMDSLVTQTVLHLLLLLVVLWVYGRERFQRDIEFMLNRPFSTWKVNLLRYVAPISLIFTLLATIFVSVHEHLISSEVTQVIAIIFVFIPLLFIPAYGICTLFESAGSLILRLKRVCRPTDWYPLDSDDRQRYEETLGNMDITHQLREVHENVY